MARRKHRNGPRRGHRRSRRHRRSFRRFVRNDSGMGRELVTSLLAGTAGYALSNLAKGAAMRFLPAMVPERELVSAGLGAAAVAVGAEMALRGKPEIRKPLVVGALVPAGEAVANRVGLGRLIGTDRLLLLPTPAAPAPAPGVAAALNAALEASLDDDPYRGAY